MKNKKILITGSKGFLGQAVVNNLEKNNYSKLFTPSRMELDLLSQKSIESFLDNEKPEIVIHLAADIGGIGYSKKHPAEQLYNNAMMNLLLQKKCYESQIEKFIGIGTVCSYPKFSPIPFKESDLWEGYPEETNAAYGISKKIMLEHSKALNQQYGFNAIHLLMINLYGPGDDFDLENSHVIPAMIRKMVEAKKKKLSNISFWGDGSPSREFLYVEDAAEAIRICMEKYNSVQPINIGNGIEIKIKDLAEKVRSITGYAGEITWDNSKPNGQPRRCLETSRLLKLGYISKTSLDEGLEKTVEYYVKIST